jgi:ComF family protein
MPFIERPFCERLGTPFAQDLGDGLLSPAAIAEPPVFERARAVALYEEGPVRKLVQQLKYADRLDLAPPMARWMARAGRELLSDADLLVPVPLYRWRLFTRRFNQAAVLARGVAELSGVAFDPMALVRVKATRPQVGLTRTQRAENVQGAFKVLPTDRIRVEGRKIVLVDDVLTSGATLNAAARVLIRAGAVRVDALVFARVMTHGL